MSVARKVQRARAREGRTTGEKWIARGKAHRIDTVSGLPIPTKTARAEQQRMLDERRHAP